MFRAILLLELVGVSFHQLQLLQAVGRHANWPKLTLLFRGSLCNSSRNIRVLRGFIYMDTGLSL